MKKNEKSGISRLNSILDFLKHSQNLLKASHAESQLLKDLSLLTTYLKSIDKQTLNEIFPPEAKTPAKSSVENDLAADTITDLSTDELSSLIEREDLPRAELEKIAVLRFAVPKGGLSVLRTKKALTDKLRDLLANEVGHEGIARIAATNPPSENP